MKKIILICTVLSLIIINNVAAQDKGRTIPAIDVKQMDGSTFNTSKIANDGKPIIISFWATWCSPCKAELNAIAENYSDWQKETGVKLIAVSIDDARNADKVGPYVNGKNWEYQVLLDINSDFKRAMNVNNVPHTFILNNKGEVVWQQNSSAPGDEDKIYELVKKLARGENIQ
jgi:cytochrome c biogenesis protein CcmG/thiol:disulfide interchange protein DsbE